MLDSLSPARHVAGQTNQQSKKKGEQIMGTPIIKNEWRVRRGLPSRVGRETQSPSYTSNRPQPQPPTFEERHEVSANGPSGWTE